MNTENNKPISNQIKKKNVPKRFYFFDDCKIMINLNVKCDINNKKKKKRYDILFNCKLIYKIN